MAVDREFYVYRFGRPRPGRTGGRTEGGRTGGRNTSKKDAKSTVCSSFFMKITKKIMFFFRRFASTGAQVPMFIAKMKNASKKDAKSIGFKSGDRASTDFYCSKINF